MCKISVIIPVYNTEKYLDKCLSSVINQTFKDIEIILIDDGSTDSSYEICKKYANDDERIILIQQSNQGQGFARNNALLKSKGEYLFFLDSDDYIELDAFKILFKEAIDKNSDLVMFGWEKRDEETNTLLYQFSKIDLLAINDRKLRIPYIFLKIAPSVWSALIKKELIIDNYLFFPNVFFEDAYIVPKIYYFAKNISCVDKIIYYYIDRQNSTVNTFSMKHAIGIGGLCVDLTNFFMKEKIYEEFKLILHKRLLEHLDLAKKRTIMFANKTEKKDILRYFSYIENNINQNIAKDIDLNPNFIFSKNINSIYMHIKYLKKYKYKIAIYGNGIIGNILARELKDQLIVIVDRDKDTSSEFSEVCTPEELNNYEFDKIVICVLGRENDIIESLKIEQNKIFEFNFFNTTLFEIENQNKLANIEIKKNYDVIFLPHNNYHFKTMALISNELDKLNISYCILDMTDYYIDKKVSLESLKFPNIAFFDLSIFLRKGINYNLLICMNDWDGKIIKHSIMHAKKDNKKTLGITQGVIDFLDMDLNHTNSAYKTVEYVFLAGKDDNQYFKDKENKYFNVGIPKIYDLIKEKPLFPEKILVVINVNFIYGFLCNKRDEWLNSVLEACKILNFEYVITQHPEDNANLEEYNISNLDVYKTIRKGSIVISRFSSIILESLSMGKPVVYHNPHNEEVLKFKQPMGAYSCSFDVKSLVEAIQYELSLKIDYRKRAGAFLNHHCYINKNISYAELSAKYIKEILDY